MEIQLISLVVAVIYITVCVLFYVIKKGPVLKTS